MLSYSGWTYSPQALMKSAKGWTKLLLASVMVAVQVAGASLCPSTCRLIVRYEHEIDHPSSV